MATYDFSKFATKGRKIVGCGLNYQSLIKMRGRSTPTEPVIFIKPPSAYITEGEKIKLVSDWTQIHHEVELGVVIGKEGYQILESAAVDYIGGYCLALDMTAIDYLNEKIRPQAIPWVIAKGFDTSCPVSDFIPRDQIPDFNNVDIWCKVNGELRQEANTVDMVFKIPQLISFASRFFTLEPGDLLLTGTPAGVGPVRSGDTIECGIVGVKTMTFRVE